MGSRGGADWEQSKNEIDLSKWKRAGVDQIKALICLFICTKCMIYLVAGSGCKIKQKSGIGAN